MAGGKPASPPKWAYWIAIVMLIMAGIYDVCAGSGRLFAVGGVAFVYAGVLFFFLVKQ